eukprot:10617640-Lingulodinium_polyedra.AAC.1
MLEALERHLPLLQQAAAGACRRCTPQAAMRALQPRGILPPGRPECSGPSAPRPRGPPPRHPWASRPPWAKARRRNQMPTDLPCSLRNVPCAHT